MSQAYSKTYVCLISLVSLYVFAIDTENIYGNMLDFFGKYTEGAIDSKFEGEFEHLLAALRTRIMNEENFLYSEYEKLDQ